MPMKAADARAMSLDQLDDEVLKLKKEQFNLRFQRATGQLENTSRVRVIRRDIARKKTNSAKPKTARRKAAATTTSRAKARAKSNKPNKSKKEGVIDAETYAPGG